MTLSERITRKESFRFTLHSSSLARVENACVSPVQAPPSGYEPGYQIVLPYYGLFAYNVGSRQWLIDPARILCISPGWEFNDEHPLHGTGHAALIISLTTDVVHRVFGARTSETNPCFVQGSVPSTRQSQLLTHFFLCCTPEADDPLGNDERIIVTLGQLECPAVAHGRSSRVIKRAKEVLHAYGCNRLSLEEIASLVGVTPVYLTQEFTRSEGVPLYQYQLRLRLNRGLLELPHCDNITELALDLGFSSHSHFTSVFRKAFGLTPSEFRSSCTSQARNVNGDAAERRQAA